jgi:predicted transcriptional regulator
LLDLSNIADKTKVSIKRPQTSYRQGKSSMTKRSRHVIVSEILDICRDGACKTRIVYQANLNFKTVQPYINILIKNNLIICAQGENPQYKTTDRGMRLLEEVKQVNCLLSEL